VINDLGKGEAGVTYTKALYPYFLDKSRKIAKNSGMKPNVRQIFESGASEHERSITA
jgi:hypothetical protein